MNQSEMNLKQRLFEYEFIFYIITLFHYSYRNLKALLIVDEKV